MRLVAYEYRGRRAIGERLGDEVREIPGLPDIPAVLAHGTLPVHGPTVPLAEVALLPPVWAPPKIVCVGINYADHAAETGRDRPDYPVLFPRWPTTLVAHGAPLVRPAASEQFDYEGELAAVVTNGGRHIPVEQALDHVGGYTIFNDASVRDYQRRTSQFTPGKNFDATGACGPEVVSADELPAGAAGLRITTRLNGVTVQDASTADLIFDVATLVATISAFMTLQPGDLIVTGTPGGVGAARTPPLWMRSGDTVEVEIEGIGTLRNPVVDEM